MDYKRLVSIVDGTGPWMTVVYGEDTKGRYSEINGPFDTYDEALDQMNADMGLFDHVIFHKIGRWSEAELEYMMDVYPDEEFE